MVELEPDGIHEIHKFKFTKEIPDVWEDLVFDALFNMRAVLDQSAYAAAACSGTTRPKRAAFAIGDDEDGFENGLKGWSGDVPEKIKTLFRGFKPYKGGNNTIWALNKVRNSAHTSLITIGLGANVSVKHFSFESFDNFDGLAPLWDSTKNEIKFMRGKRGQPCNYDASPSFIVGLNATEFIGGGQTAVGFLDAAFGEVKNVLIATESACRALGYFS